MQSDCKIHGAALQDQGAGGFLAAYDDWSRVAMMLDRITQWMDGLERFVTAVTAVLLALITILIGWQVVARYVFHSGQFWADEVTLIGIMWATMLGAAGCVWTDSHVSLTYVVSALPGRLRLCVLTVLDLIVFGFSIILSTEGITLASRTMGGKISSFGIPIGVTYLILPAAGTLMALFILTRSVRRIVAHLHISTTEGPP